MFFNYFKIALRNIMRQKTFTIINISGLALGMSLFILAVLYSNFNFNFDTFHKDSDKIYILTRNVPLANSGIQKNMYTPSPLKPLLENQFPEIEDITRYIPFNSQVIKVNDKKIYENLIRLADDNFFTFFSFEFIYGKPESALENPDSIVITENMAIKYYGHTNPTGETLNMAGVEYTVTGVLKTPPYNSSINSEFFISSSSAQYLQEWDTISTTFIKLKKGVTPFSLEGKLSDFLENNAPPIKENNESTFLFPIEDLHLGSIGYYTDFPKVPAFQFYLVLAIGAALLLIVSINFMNLSTARYFNRAKEVGMRKVLGAEKNQLIKQFLGESILLSLISLPLAMTLFEMIRPAFLSFIGINMDLSFSQNPIIIYILIFVSVLLGLISGSYPALFLSSFKPSSVLKDNLKTGKKGTKIRKILVITQFSMAVILIVLTLVSVKQFDYLLKVDLGYNRENIVVLPITNEIKNSIEPLKQELLRHPEIISVSASNWQPIDWGPKYKIKPEGFNEKEQFLISAFPVNYDYIETLNMSVTQGRSFSKEFNDENNIIISQSAADYFKWKQPVGKKIQFENFSGTVVGVVENFHFNHVFFKKEPSILFLKSDWQNLLLIKTQSTNNPLTSAFIEEQWDKFIPDAAFEYSTLEQRFEDRLRETTKIIEVFKLISIMSVFIASLGLIGLASYTAEQRTKEIGIRKILGASSKLIANMLIKDFLKLVLISNIIAIPFAYIICHIFLEFAWAERIDIGLSFFVLAIAITVIATVISVGIQTIKVSIENPINALRNE